MFRMNNLQTTENAQKIFCKEPNSFLLIQRFDNLEHSRAIIISFCKNFAALRIFWLLLDIIVVGWPMVEVFRYTTIPQKNYIGFTFFKLRSEATSGVCLFDQ